MEGSDLTPDEERLVIKDITTVAQAQMVATLWLDYVNQDMSTATNSGASHGSDYHDTVGSSAPKRPSSIDNSDFVSDVGAEDSNSTIVLNDALTEGRDYILLPQEVWKQLYGGGPIVTRKAISSGLSQNELSVEVYPLHLRLLVMPKGEQAFVRISKKETVGELHRRACEVFDLILEQVCIWDYYGNQKHALMNNMAKTLEDANIQMDQDILVEVLNDSNGTAFGGFMSSVQDNGSIEKDSISAIADPCRSGLCIAGGLLNTKGVSRSCSSELSQSQILASPARDADTSYGMSTMGMRGASGGLTGLQNLGNTCFMNSAIQCLVHTPEFARYFREDYTREINCQNPLGMVEVTLLDQLVVVLIGDCERMSLLVEKLHATMLPLDHFYLSQVVIPQGELATAFGDLLRKLWAPGRTPVAPRPFKAKLARFAPQFSGYNQHDSQELLAFLLDGLHEDLNRVKNKPYIKSKDADGRSDEEVADEYWANHIARNDSIIVDVCQNKPNSSAVSLDDGSIWLLEESCLNKSL
ncbi:ubiquitin-specific protease [Asimina triloba]